MTQQALFIAQKIDASDIAYRWEWQLGRLLKAQGNIEGAIAAYDTAAATLMKVTSAPHLESSSLETVRKRDISTVI